MLLLIRNVLIRDPVPVRGRRRVIAAVGSGLTVQSDGMEQQMAV